MRVTIHTAAFEALSSGTPATCGAKSALVQRAAPHIKGIHMTTRIQTVLAALILDKLTVGVRNTPAPENFSHNAPTADVTPHQNLRPETQAAGVR